MSTVIIGFGWFGFGMTWGLIPELRLGVLSLAWCHGYILEKFQEMNRALKAQRYALSMIQK